MRIFGAGGFGRETLDACLAAGMTIDGFLDDHTTGTVAGLPIDDPERVAPGSFVVAMADPVARFRVHRALVAAGWSPESVVDPRAVVGSRSTLGPGSVVLATAFVSCDVQLGAATHVNYGVSIGHDVTSGAAATVLPGARVGGNVSLGERVLVGSGSTILQGLRIGTDVVVGAGAVVTRDVPPGRTVVGVPARLRGG